MVCVFWVTGVQIDGVLKCVCEEKSHHMATEKQLVMKGLFRLCAGICASEVYQAASHVQVSLFLTFINVQF